MEKPTLFIGSSSEGLEVARAIEYQLKDDGEVTIWNEGIFGLSLGTLESLVNAIERFDFAILVLTPDDLIVSRDISIQAPRDNVMFELGLFIGRLGRSRTFIVCDGDNKNMRLPSDLAGVT
ncbi:MAG: nucleotide-binding protein, partial [bacterium]